MKYQNMDVMNHGFTIPEFTHVRGEDDIYWGGTWPFNREKVRILEPSVAQIMAIDPVAHPGTYVNTTASQAKEYTDSNDKWCGGTYSEMLKRRTGWREGAQRLYAEITRIAPDYGHAKRPRPYWDNDGYDLDLSRFDDFHDRPFINRKLRRGPKIIQVTIQFGNNCGWSSERLYWRGAAALAAVDTLEDMGYRVELVAVTLIENLYRDSTYEHVLRVTLKHPQDPVDIESLASTTSSVLFFRGNAFNLWRCMPHAINEDSLGRSITVPDALRGQHFIGTIPDGLEAAGDLYREIVMDVVKQQETLVS